MWSGVRELWQKQIRNKQKTMSIEAPNIATRWERNISQVFYWEILYAVRKTRTKLHPGPKWHIFHILTSEHINDVISRFYLVENGQRVRLHNKQKITQQLVDMNFIFSWWEHYFNSLVALVRKILFSPLENKIHIFMAPCDWSSIHTPCFEDWCQRLSSAASQ